jgi:transposase
MKIDGRTLSHDTLETIRLMAVRRVEEGEKPIDVIKSYGFCRTVIYRWLRKNREGGQEALQSRKAPGPEPQLTVKQKEKVRIWINGKDPRQHGFDFGLWTRKTVAHLIEKKFGLRLGLTTIGRLLAELGITPQKPLRRAYERDPEAIAHWLKVEYPKLRRRAKARGADIFFLDEAGIRSDSPLGRTWAPRGQTPVVPTSGRRQAINAISAVNARGGFWYRTFTGSLNASRFLGFLQDFLRARRRPVFLVLDSHPSHRAKIVSQFIHEMKGRIELHFLPGYAPDLNPDEFVWNHLRAVGVTKKPLQKNESLRERVEADLARIKSLPRLVRSFFQAPTVSYAMD